MVSVRSQEARAGLRRHRSEGGHWHSERLKGKNTRFKGGSYESREQGQAQRGADKRFF